MSYVDTNRRGVEGKPATIETYTGLTVDLGNPTAAMVNGQDIAAGLGNTCRFGGHTSAYYSVAEHSILVADIVAAEKPSRPWLHLAALLHDAHEAYLGDVPSPMKPLLGYVDSMGGSE